MERKWTDFGNEWTGRGVMDPILVFLRTARMIIPLFYGPPMLRIAVMQVIRIVQEFWRHIAPQIPLNYYGPV